MKILFVTPYLCYPEVPYAGGITIYKLMERLYARGHEVFLITGLRPGDKEYLEEVKSLFKVLDAIEIPWTKVEILPAVAEWFLRGFKGGLTFRKKAAMSVKRFSKEIPFDIIQIEHTELGECIERPDEIPIVIDAHDVLIKPALREYRLSKGIKKTIKYIRYKTIEKKEISVYKRFDRVYVRSDFDRNKLLSCNKDLDISILPPYVRVEDFEGIAARREPDTILFVGAMDRPANISAVRYFYEKVLPLIKKEIPGAKFYVVGNMPPEEIRRLGYKNKDVIVTGFVKDIKPFYLRASVFVAPLFIGGGIIVKILDAIAAGLPVVTTDIGNEGIEAFPDRDILIANEPVDFANKVILLIKDKGHWHRLSGNSKSFVHKKFNWGRIVQKLEDEYKMLVACNQRSLS
jgi:glycosyltransferase involved in cell wall biosynthesis